MHSGLRPLSVSLRDAYFCHWSVPAAAVAAALPSWLSPDTADGTAWISAVAVEMAAFETLGVPIREGVGAVNLRTYVRGPGGDRGVYFLSVDADDRLAVETARRVFRMPYHRASVDRERREDGTRVTAHRRNGLAAFAATFASDSDPTTANPDTIASFLLERYRYFTEGPLGTRLVGSVGHDPWRVAPATVDVESNTLLAAADVRVDDAAPLAHYSPGTEMRIGPPAPVRP